MARLAAAFLATMTLGGCSLGGGRIPLASKDPDRTGFKMLRPAATVRTCGATVWPYGARSAGPFLEKALASLLALDEEADVLQDVDVSWRGVDLLVVRLGCVSVRADVGRTIPTVSLPMLGGHPEGLHGGDANQGGR